ncbi:ABC transporter substrate binding protein [Anaerocolumna sp.]|uniref:ABC transporter substrate binding protein n=1 Tax=Anaerocolumna sp. TaxID=2041569 RepID=UPI0028AB7B40|nr:ABC transporter substrate binding protein [Anaerocolumna sp.]
MHKEMKYFKVGFMLLVLLLFMCWQPWNKTIVFGESTAKRVLFISSYDGNFLSVPDQIAGVKSVFEFENIYLDIEYMDTKRFDTQENVHLFYNTLKYKLDHLESYDAVIAGDDNALQFVMDYQEELFYKMPVIFLGINDLARGKKAAEDDYITGIVEETSIKDNIDLGIRLNPKASRIVAIVDNTLTGVGNKEQFYSYEKAYDNLLFEDINTSEYTFKELEEVLERIDQDTIVLYFSMYSDKTGKYLTIEEACEILAAHTKVPILRSEVGGIGLGILGGRMVSYYDAGKIAGNMVLSVFQGTPVKDINMIEESPNRYMFDYQVLQKYNINKKMLPEDSIILNRTFTYLEENKDFLIKALFVITVLFIIIAILLYDNRKQRRMERKLQESHEELSQTFEELTATEEELRAQYETIEKHARDIEHLAQHDYLTDLPNRLSFNERLRNEIDSGKQGAILLLDIDNFKEVNDTLGHVYGDKLLQSISERLLNLSDDTVFVSRFGGDEFLILIANEEKKERIEAYIHKILIQFKKALDLDYKEYFVNFSIGISMYPKDSSDADRLIMNVDTAMYAAKREGRNNYKFYCESMQDELMDKKEVEAILRNAVKEEGFLLLYQPQVDVKTGFIAGFEALLRIKGYNITPLKFIPVAEDTGLITEIGRWVTRKVVEQIAEWKEKGYETKPISVNFSSKQLQDTTYADFLRRILQENGVEAKYFELEITESILLEKSSNTLEFLNTLKDMGIRIALDDFGTGYSSLNYLTFIPVNKIKLDKSLCEKFLELSNMKVMNSIIGLAHSLDLVITAEGVEDMEQYKRLKKGGCDYIQGYLFSKPVKSEEIEKIYHINMLDKKL